MEEEFKEDLREQKTQTPIPPLLTILFLGVILTGPGKGIHQSVV
jgi:hypothetical protein